jgi:flagellar basal-body rod protein FlgB
MSDFEMFTGTISTLERSLDLRSKRHRVLASNIANIDTPNYKAFDLEIKEAFQRGARPGDPIGMQRSHPAHLTGRTGPSGSLPIKPAAPPQINLRSDGNTVDLDRSMGQLSENTILYKATTQLISRKFEGLKNVIRGGK